MKTLFIFSILLIIQLSAYSHAQEFLYGGANAWVDVGYISAASSDSKGKNFDAADGMQLAVGLEKYSKLARGYLVFQVNGGRVSAKSRYYYNNAGVIYSSSSNAVPASINLLSVDLGYKIKLLEDKMFQPFVEGGFSAGSMKVDYRNLGNSLVIKPNENYSSSERTNTFGGYIKVGAEIRFVQNILTQAGFMYKIERSKEFETLNSASVDMNSIILFFGLRTDL